MTEQTIETASEEGSKDHRKNLKHIDVFLKEMQGKHKEQNLDPWHLCGKWGKVALCRKWGTVVLVESGV